MDQDLLSTTKGELERLAEQSTNLGELALQWSHKENKQFFVEYSQDGADHIYHFFPPMKMATFNNGAQFFGVKLESAFKKYLPDDADVRADYITLNEAKINNIARYTDFIDKIESPAAETFWVRVIGMSDNPMGKKILEEKVIKHLEKILDNPLI